MIDGDDADDDGDDCDELSTGEGAFERSGSIFFGVEERFPLCSLWQDVIDFYIPCMNLNASWCLWRMLAPLC